MARLNALLCLLAASVVLLDFASSELTPEFILEEAKGLQEWLVQTRRNLHQIPELGFNENQTSRYIMRTVDQIGTDYSFGYAKTGLVVKVGSGHPIVVLRADMDALPIQEPKGLPFASKHAGAMHACGHDAHTAMLLGAATILKRHEEELPPGSVWLVHQPAEEGGAGADPMIEQGAIAGASAAFALHVLPSLPSGHFSTKVGTIMAGAVVFDVTVRGRGGHAALPHLNVDPVVAAAAVVQALQTLVSRETSPMASAVLSVTRLRAGEAYNVIPDYANFGGTIRASSDAQMQALRQRFSEVAQGVAAAYGCSAEVDWMQQAQPYYPPTVNDPGAVEVARRAAASVFGASSVHEAEGLMAGEDFAFFCREVPCAFGFIGIRNETLGSVHNLHSPNFLLDEEVLHLGTAYHVAVAVEYLRAAAATTQAIQLPDAAAAADVIAEATITQVEINVEPSTDDMVDLPTVLEVEPGAEETLPPAANQPKDEL